jgi:hypothetical protein
MPVSRARSRDAGSGLEGGRLPSRMALAQAVVELAVERRPGFGRQALQHEVGTDGFHGLQLAPWCLNELDLFNRTNRVFNQIFRFASIPVPTGFNRPHDHQQPNSIPAALPPPHAAWA